MSEIEHFIDSYSASVLQKNMKLRDQHNDTN